MSACTVEVIKLVGKYLNTSVGPICYNTDKVLTTVLDKENVEGFASIVLKLAAKSGSQMSQEQNLLSYQWLEHIAMFSNQAAANPSFAKNFLQDINKALERSTYVTGQFLTIADITLYYVLYSLLHAKYLELLIDNRLCWHSLSSSFVLPLSRDLMEIVDCLQPLIIILCEIGSLGSGPTKGLLTPLSASSSALSLPRALGDPAPMQWELLLTPPACWERLSISEREQLLHLCRWSKHIQAQPRVCATKPPLPLNTLTLSVLAPAVH